MVTSTLWNIFRIAGPLWGECTCQQWIPPTKGSVLPNFAVYFYIKQTVQQRVELMVTWNVMTPMWRHWLAMFYPDSPLMTQSLDTLQGTVYHGWNASTALEDGGLLSTKRLIQGEMSTGHTTVLKVGSCRIIDKYSVSDLSRDRK